MTATVHARTPALAVSDGRGLPIRQVAYLRSVAGKEATALISRQTHDVHGRLVAQWDPRLPVSSISTVHGLAGEALSVASVDAGWRLSLPGLAAEPLHRWDERGGHWRSTFDDQLRIVAVEGRDATDVDTFIYADASADAGLNLRGQMLEQKDPSGALRVNSYALTGQPLSETRTFLDGEAFTSQHVFNPLGAVLEQIDAGDHRQQSNYGQAGQLRQLLLLVKGQTEEEAVLLDAQYNAAGQIIEQLAGNGVRSRWTYDPANGRLRNQSSRKDAKALQDFEYFYDPVGNITRIDDHAFASSWFANQLVDGHRDFSYDSLYRLISASGYDDGPLSDIPGLPQPTDPKNRLNYTQIYTYDTGGNLTELVHERAGAGYTRQMRIDPTSNRGVRWQPGDPEPVFGTLFDRHGNLLAVQPGQPLQWNARDELENVTLIHREGVRMMPSITTTARVSGCSNAIKPSAAAPNILLRCTTCRVWKSATRTMAKNCTSSASAMHAACIGRKSPRRHQQQSTALQPRRSLGILFDGAGSERASDQRGRLLPVRSHGVDGCPFGDRGQL